MMKIDAAHTSKFRTAYFVFGVMLVLGVVFQMFHPLSFPAEFDSATLKMIGTPLLILCTLIIFFSKSELAQNDQPSEPCETTTKVVSTGMFKYSRNPLYLGLVFGLVGLGVSINMPWWVVFAVPAIIATQVFLINPEEKYLIQKFGVEYTDYMKRVRRWI